MRQEGQEVRKAVGILTTAYFFSIGKKQKGKMVVETTNQLMNQLMKIATIPKY